MPRRSTTASPRRCHYVHATGGSLPVGKVVRARTSPQADDFWRWIDRQRPKGAPARSRAFFLAEKPATLFDLGAASVKRLYRAEPVGSSVRVDPNWLVAAARLGNLQGRITPQLEQLVASYWKGKASPWFAGWEVVAPSIYVCEQLTPREKTRELARAPRESVERLLLDRAVRYARIAGTNRVSLRQQARSMGLPRSAQPRTVVRIRRKR